MEHVVRQGYQALFAEDLAKEIPAHYRITHHCGSCLVDVFNPDCIPESELALENGAYLCRHCGHVFAYPLPLADCGITWFALGFGPLREGES